MPARAARGLQMPATCSTRVACARVRAVRVLPRQATDRTHTRMHARAACDLQMQVTCSTRTCVACGRRSHASGMRGTCRARSARVSCARVYIARACCMWQATCSTPTCVGCGWVTKDFACLMGRANQSVIVPPTWACVCGCGGGSCPSPLPGSWHRSNWRCESSRHSRDLRAPIRADQRSPGGAVTQGQPSYPFGPNHAVLSLAHGLETGS